MIYIKHEGNSVKIIRNGYNFSMFFDFTISGSEVVCNEHINVCVDELTMLNKALNEGYTDRGCFVTDKQNADDGKMYVSWIVANNGQFDIGVCVNTKWKENGKQKLALNRKVLTESENVVDYIFNSGFLNTAPYK
ncbi:MAG: hypothetical protein NC311_10760 [Muribaculaceae bacterium]|nr:hypothetical protein [Muribaculaceae bacterium]